MASARWDETWHRLREWTNGQAQSERLSAQILISEGFTGLDPIHPLGGKDGGGDGTCMKNGTLWVMACSFPRGQKTITALKKKFTKDLKGARKKGAQGIVFVTNQEILLATRKALAKQATPELCEIYHLERNAMILDSPPMTGVRKQFLKIDYDDPPMIVGGQGGSAPGAGGGGGGVIGNNSHGGPGGPGGKITHGAPATAPGAGGGGAGAIGEGATPGGGGGGGELVSVTIEGDELKALHHVDFLIGQGGTSDSPGTDTIARLVAEDGAVLRTIVAKGGSAGSTGHTRERREASSEDLTNGLRVVSFQVAQGGQVRDGLLYLLGAGCDLVRTSVPFDHLLPVAVSIIPGGIEDNTQIDMKLIVTDPVGTVTMEESCWVSKGQGSAHLVNFLLSARLTGGMLGKWTISLESGGLQLAVLAIAVEATT